jgi:ribonuclease J
VEVIYNKLAQVHVHIYWKKSTLEPGQAQIFYADHGEYRHLSLHAKLAEAVGIPKANVFVMEDGDILELNAQSARIAGKINAGNVYVDGLSVGDVGNVVLHDRRVISRDGMAVVVLAVNKDTGHLVGRPDIVSRGFVDTREAKDLIEASRDHLALNHQTSSPIGVLLVRRSKTPLAVV